MAPRSKSRDRRDRDDDSSESLKPLVVLVLLGTILYGAWSVVSKGPAGTAPVGADASATAELAAAPSFAPQVEIPTAAPAATQPTQTSPSASFPGAVPALPNAVVAPPAAATAAVPAGPPPAEAAAGPTYLSAAAAPPPVADLVGSDRPATPPLGQFAASAVATGAAAGLESPASLPAAPAATAAPSAPPLPAASSTSAPFAAAGPVEPAGSAPAFASAWADAHDKLAAGRYAEALAVLSAWHDDPSLGLEESQRLEDLLGQLAGTVVYSQQDLLLPPHVVAQGETLQSIAAPLAVPWQLLAKINGVADPARLIQGEYLKVVRGPFDAVVSISRRRLSLRISGSYAGSFAVVVGRQVRDHVGTAVPILAVQSGGAATAAGGTVQAAWSQPAGPGSPAVRSIALAGGLTIEAVADPANVTEDSVPGTSLVVSDRDLADLADILGPGSKLLLRQ
jgi:hypothetical protein